MTEPPRRSGGPEGPHEPPAADEASFSIRSTVTAEDLSARRAPARGVPLGWLLLVPAVLAAGWLLGHTTSHAPKSRPAAEAPASDVVPVVSPEAAGLSTAPAPEPAPPPAAEKPGRLSNWTTVASSEDESRRTGKPIMLDFNAAWCPPCRAMKSEVFESLGRGEAVRRAVVPVSVVDRSREDGANAPEIEALMQDWSIEAFPTLVVYMPGSGRSMQRRGYGDPDETLRWIENAARTVR